ncbi:NrfD/PsrC family molybdoenzyme membrane anchor subunit [Allochromatium vinosum]|uniref:Polysulphide reductase NrfD n=1 Tax=Allochromatium vinosum (strain ATCC 17899 / DSM 180 / NBRC 103801 / NCIMB 10441 / D) TaxID=572477 RepID=D3RSU7_ALLVD|nr:NrfD/PsrC family molybdoenzyme membrane anchor subunit [Allochromatium vinosum]ADC62256.1 Polysulphide reductase NrfD [Allochromatium vinosum DSM 180]
MDVNMTYATQDMWTWWLAIYLYFGGLGAATLAVTFLTDMYLKPNRALVIWGAGAGVVLLALGSLMLFGHLLDKTAVLTVLNPLALFNQSSAWIAWGTQFIIWMMVWGVLYALPYVRETEFPHKVPVIRDLIDKPFVIGTSRLVQRFHRSVGWLAVINGVGVAVYTGLLLQSFPAVALWHNPAVPLLFTVSAFSTAMAFLLVLMYTLLHDQADEHVRVLYERIDLVLIAAELVILFSLYQYLKNGSESGVRSMELLWNDYGWLIGFIGFGLIVPFLLELKGVMRGWASRVPILTAAVLVLAGGYLLRHYFMYAGVYAYPW